MRDLRPTLDSKTEDYFNLLLANGMVAITSIIPDGRTETETFIAGEQNHLFLFLEHSNAAGRNVYYQLSPVKKRITSKAKKDDISVAAGFHVDIDPPEEVKQPGLAREDWKGKKIEELRQFNPKPSAIINSGNGLQAIWFLKQPTSNLALVEHINKCLLSILGGDKGTHDISRLLRVPGFTNFPSAKKKSDGYTQTQAEMIDLKAPNFYCFEDFDHLNDQVEDEAGEINLQQERDFACLDMLQNECLTTLGKLPPEDLINHQILSLPIELWELANFGFEHRFVSGELHDRADRSALAALFAFISLVFGMKVEDIASILTNPEFCVSEHAFRKGSLDWRSVERAIEWGIMHLSKNDLELVELNRQFKVVTIGGRTIIAQFRVDPELGQEVFDVLTFKAFEDKFRNQSICMSEEDDEKPKYKPIGRWFLDHHYRPTYLGTILEPKKTEPGYLNLWRGYGVEPKAGDCTRILDHVYQVLADENKDHNDYIIQYMGWCVQNPHLPAEVALSFIGGRGTGKGTIGNILVQIFGCHGMQIFSSDLLTGRFNGHHQNKCFIFADEAVHVADPQSVSRLKGLITEPNLSIERKGIDAYSAANRLKVVIASNEQRAIPAGIDERRFAVFKVSDKYKGNTDYFDNLYNDINGGAISAFLWHLLNIELGDWHPRSNVPQTEALIEQKKQNLQIAEQVIFNMLWEAELPAKSCVDGGHIPTSALLEYAKEHFPKEHITANKIGEVLRRLGFGKAPRSTNERAWRIPPLPEARAAWDVAIFTANWNKAKRWEPLYGPF